MAERTKGGEQSAPRITAAVNEKYRRQGLLQENFLKEFTVRVNAKPDRAGKGLPRKGRERQIPDVFFAAAALQTQINQAAGKEEGMKAVWQKIKNVPRFRGYMS